MSSVPLTGDDDEADGGDPSVYNDREIEELERRSRIEEGLSPTLPSAYR